MCVTLRTMLSPMRLDCPVYKKLVFSLPSSSSSSSIHEVASKWVSRLKGPISPHVDRFLHYRRLLTVERPILPLVIGLGELIICLNFFFIKIFIT
jgi:hypothetical protein